MRLARIRTVAGVRVARISANGDRALPPGDAIPWTSDGSDQGSVCCSHCTCLDNGCAAKGTCGLPYSNDGLGGGWELCFA